MSQQLVAEIKAQLVARGVNLSGDCGGFEITKRVAWALRAQGYSLFWKGGGANCQGYSTDRVLDGEGYLIDVLGDSGGNNDPQWGKQDRIYPEDQPKRRPPIDPGDGGEFKHDELKPPSADLEAIKQSMDSIKQRMDEMDNFVRERLESLNNSYNKLKEKVEAIKPPPVLELPELIVEGSTSRELGHAHQIRLTTRPK
jgi:hypothetical protein